MKKIISILLALVMMLSVFSITAFADDIDFTAYDSIVLMIDEIDATPYTDESIKALKDSIADRDSLSSQEDIDNAVKAIATAYTNLQKKSFDLDFVITNSNGDMKISKAKYFYGDTAKLVVDGTDEVVTKWVLSTPTLDTKLASSVDTMEIVVDCDMLIEAYTAVSQEIQQKMQQVKFYGANNKLVAIKYVLDTDDIDMPDAPSLPFYTFDGWLKVDDTTYQAKYTMNAVCNGTIHVFDVIVVPSSCITYGYLIFQCECGEAFRTDYSYPLGHDFEPDEEYCVNGCGTYNESFEEIESNPDPEPIIPDEPETLVTPDVDFSYGFDEGGYSNAVIMP